MLALTIWTTIIILISRKVVGSEVYLPLGEINVVVLTDVHSFVGGRGKKEIYSADYGHVLSFYERLRKHCLHINKDLWFVVNGDWIDGTGLAMNSDPSFLVPLLEKMPWDAVNIGNHELYDNQVIEYAMRPGGFVSWWGERYLSSNVRYAASQQPLGSKYILLQGHKTVLCFGFLYNMKDSGSLISVMEVESVIEEKWFEHAVRNEEYDAILVLAHMGVQDALVSKILDKIRSYDARVPVQFLTGHTHVRGYHQLDNCSASAEAGHYLDTVGFVSFPSKDIIENTTVIDEMSLFRHKFIDANVDILAEILGLDDLLTPSGRALSVFIDKTRKELGLEEVVGCVETDLYLNRSLHDKDSLWKFFADHIAPSTFDSSHVLVFDKGVWRYDLHKGDIILDELLRVAAFNETLWLWEDIPSDVLLRLNSTLNPADKTDNWLPGLPDYLFIHIDDITLNSTHTMVTDTFDRERIAAALRSIYDVNVTLQPAKLTLSQLWVNYFVSNDLCGSHNDFDFNFPDSHEGHNPTKGSASSDEALNMNDPELDMMRVGFVIMSSIFVVCLVGLHVQQRGSVYRQQCAQEELEIVEAQRAFDDEEDRFLKLLDVRLKW